jgi:hypothetical protein
MMGTVLRRVLLVAVPIFVVGCGSAPEPAAVEQGSAEMMGVTPGTSINAIMVALVDHAGHNLWNVEKEGMAPKTDADWLTVEEHAVQLIAAAPAITSGGTGVTDMIWSHNPSWRAHAQQMADAGAAALAAANARNLDALVAANGQVVESCEGCHKEFKPDLPTEGIVHTHDH